MGFGKKHALQKLGVSKDHLAEPLMGRPVVLSDDTLGVFK